MSETSSVFLHHIEVAHPERPFLQASIGKRLSTRISAGDRLTEKLIHRIYSHSGIERRHLVLDEFAEDAPSGQFYDAETDTLLTPTTRERNERYAAVTREMAPELACRLVENCPGITLSDITHVITVSCTGFFQPGPDYVILRALGLPAHLPRFHVGFMGCYAMFPALKIAQAFCQANPDAVVLVLSLELCSLHLQWTRHIDDLLAGSVFADGASAAIVSAKTPQSDLGLRLDTFSTAIAPEGEETMAWSISDTGFQIRLSTAVPDIIEANIVASLEKPLTDSGLTQSQIDGWAVHPGGRAILDKVERGLSLDPGALDVSRSVLRDYGNMSSATILFVLDRMRRATSPGDKIAALAFGPGLTIESAILSRV